MRGRRPAPEKTTDLDYRNEHRELGKVRAAGYDKAQFVEIVQHVALNTWTNYINSVAQTVVGFPVATARKAD